MKENGFGQCATNSDFPVIDLTAKFLDVCDRSNGGVSSHYIDKEFHKKKKTTYDCFSVSDSVSDEDSVNEYIRNIGDERKFYVTTPYQANLRTPFSCDSLDSGIEIRNKTELGEVRKVRFDDVQSELSEFDCDLESLLDVESDDAFTDLSRNNSILGRPIYDVTELFDNLDLKEYQDKSVQTENTDQEIEEEARHTLNLTEFGGLSEGEIVEIADSDTNEKTEDEENSLPMKDISEITMSKEARFAIIETLQDMKSKGSQENINTDIRNKGVTAQKRLQNNRLKYNRYKTMTETKNLFTDSGTQYTTNHRSSISRYKSFDSEGNTAADDYSSAFSSELNAKESDGSSSAEEVRPRGKGKLLPSINNKRKSAKRLSSAASRFYSLEKAKMTNYRIPGIGKFDIVASPDSDFRITPVGFDSRYEPQPIIYKEEREPPPGEVQAKSIQKCKKWLKNVHLSPLSSLQPVHK